MTQTADYGNDDAGRGTDEPVCWVLSDGKPGMENQCRGLAEAIGIRTVIKRIDTRAPWRWLPPRLWAMPLAAIGPRGDSLVPPWPDLLIASGRQSVAPAASVREASLGKTFCVQIQSPHLNSRRFDLVVVPEHDRLRGENVVPTRGALHLVTRSRLREAAIHFDRALADLPRPLVTVLVGGSNSDYTMDAGLARRFGQQLADLARAYGASLAVTTSRRTGSANAAALREGIGASAPVYFWNGKGENPYFGLLALADAIVVTADSVSMASEACSTGKPVYVVPLRGRSRKIDGFHETLRRAGITRPFDGTLERWAYPPMDETERVATIVRDRLSARGIQVPPQAADSGLAAQ